MFNEKTFEENLSKIRHRYMAQFFTNYFINEKKCLC